MTTKLPFGRSIAAVIGIDRYTNGIATLRTAANDAGRLADVLESEHGYETLRVLDEAASLDRLGALFTKELPARLGPDDRLLVYYAGHGVALDGEEGPNGYLLPQDARPGDPSSYLFMPAVHDALLALECRHLLLVLDCCFAGAFRWSATRDLRRRPGVIHRERFDRFVHDPAWQVITSASHDQKALDELSAGALGSRGGPADAAGHSPFAAALFEGLAGAGDLVPAPHGDGVMTATELYVFLEDRLQPLTIDHGSRQTPGLWPLRKHEKGEFVFLIPGREPDLPPAPPLTYDNNPYRGLESYDRRHAAIFFGRDAVIEALRARVDRPLTVVLGASGTGKSSVVKAGLLPALEREEGAPWHVLSVVRPGPHPVASLLRSLEHLPATSDAGPFAAAAAMARVDDWLAANPDGRLALVVDQFEEMVTLCASAGEREEAIGLLARLIERPRVHLVLTLRSDFEPLFADSPLRDDWRAGRFVVPPFSQAELRQIIERPASERVLYLEPAALVDDLIDEVLQMPGGLPLLSFTLSEMYVRYVNRQSDDRALTRSDYDALGGVIGALRHRANEEYEALDPAHRETMRRIMLRLVSTEGGSIVRSWVLRSALEYDEAAAPGENARAARVLDALIRGRLLVQDVDAIGGASVEPAHDALVSAWDRLLEWIHDAERVGPSLAWRERFGRAAEEWSGTDAQQRGGLLWQDPGRSAQLNQLLRTNADWLNARERAFARRSVRRHRIRMATTVVVTVAIAAGGLGSGWFGIDARRKGEEARIAGENAQEAAARAEREARQVQSNAVGAWVRTERDPMVGALLLADLRDRDLPAPVGGEEQVIRAMSALNAMAPTFLGHGWDYVPGSPPATMSLLLRVDAGLAVTSVREPALARAEYDGAPEAGSVAPHENAVALVFQDHVVQYGGRKLGRHAGRVNRLLFSADGEWIVTGSDDGSARVWATHTERDPIVLDARDGAVTDVAISADGGTVATAHAAGVSRVWRIGDDGARELSRLARRGSARTVALTADGTTAVTGYGDGSIVVWSVGDPTRTTELHSGSPVEALAITPDSAAVLAVGGGRLSFWRTDTPGSSRSVRLDAAANAGGTLPFSGRESVARVWDELEPGRVRPRITIDAGATAARVVADTTGRMFSVPLVLPPRSTRFEAGAPVERIAVSRDGAAVVAKLRDGTTRTFGLDGGTAARTTATEPAPAEPQGRWTADVVDDGVDVRRTDSGASWRLRLDKPLDPGLNEFESRVVFAPDSSTIAYIQETGGRAHWALGVWNLADGSRVLSLEGGGLTCLALAPRAAAAAVCSTRSTIDTSPGPTRLYWLDGSSRTLELGAPTRWIETPGADSGYVRGVAFSRDGKWALTWGDYLDAVLSRTDGSGTPVALEPHAAAITAGTFSEDGRRVVTVSADGGIHVESLTWEGLGAALRSKLVACLAPSRRVQYLGETDSIATATWLDCEVRFGRKTRAPSATQPPPAS